MESTECGGEDKGAAGDDNEDGPGWYESGIEKQSDSSQQMEIPISVAKTLT